VQTSAAAAAGAVQQGADVRAGVPGTVQRLVEGQPVGLEYPVTRLTCVFVKHAEL